MRRINSIFITLLFIAQACANTPMDTDSVAENIRYLIGPVSESDKGWSGAQAVAKCVSVDSRETISPDSYGDFEAELEAYVSEIAEFTNGISISSGQENFPEVSIELEEYLEMLIPSVQQCEKAIGVTVEF